MVRGVVVGAATGKTVFLNGVVVPRMRTRLLPAVCCRLLRTT